MKKRRLAILGSTGSIGTQALEVAALHPDRFEVAALTAYSSREKLFEQVRAFRPRLAGLVQPIPREEIPAKGSLAPKRSSWLLRRMQTTCW